MDDKFPEPVVALRLHGGAVVPDSPKMGASNATAGRRRLSSTAKQTSMYHMLGSFYSHIWVGTPPQRVSVIVDTGSHYTAFPCVGCKCGKHMDPYFDPTKSSTASVPTCSGTRCFFKQSYSEGSSWHAYRVRDTVWVGGESVLAGPNAANLSTKFDFGCQDMETGLFRTQYVDGIMGLAGSQDTLPHVLHASGRAQSKVFAMCFRLGGGILTLGGVDSSIHTLPQPSVLPRPSSVLFAKQMARKPAGWFAVRLLDVQLRHPVTGVAKSIGVAAHKYNTGKGAIIDSGTTDTYLPASSLHNFAALFRIISGVTYSNGKRDLTRQEYDSLPTVIYCLEDTDGKTMHIESPPSSYTETITRTGFSITAQPRYAFRIYPTEPSGTVLGANFMLGYNVIFDYDGRRVGFAKSDCQAHLSAQSPQAPASPHGLRTTSLSSQPGPSSLSSSSGTDLQATTPFDQLDAIFRVFADGCGQYGGGVSYLTSGCNATCAGVLDSTAITAVAGFQEWSVKNGCGNSSSPAEVVSRVVEPCHVLCSAGSGVGGAGAASPPSMVRDHGRQFCFAGAWSPCRSNCTQERVVSALRASGRCVQATESRRCQAHKCPLYAGSHVALDLTIRHASLESWSFAHKEDIFLGLSRTFNVPEGQLHAQSGALHARPDGGLSLQVQLRLPASQHGGRDRCEALGLAIAASAQKPSFPTVLTLLLNGNQTAR